jgi:hypothetical protein
MSKLFATSFMLVLVVFFAGSASTEVEPHHIAENYQ